MTINIEEVIEMEDRIAHLRKIESDLLDAHLDETSVAKKLSLAEMLISLRQRERMIRNGVV